LGQAVHLSLVLLPETAAATARSGLTLNLQTTALRLFAQTAGAAAETSNLGQALAKAQYWQTPFATEVPAEVAMAPLVEYLCMGPEAGLALHLARIVKGVHLSLQVKAVTAAILPRPPHCLLTVSFPVGAVVALGLVPQICQILALAVMALFVFGY
jgi:hypothetical protein